MTLQEEFISIVFLCSCRVGTCPLSESLGMSAISDFAYSCLLAWFEYVRCASILSL